MNLPVLADCIPRTQSQLSRYLGLLVLKLFGWHIKGEFPSQPKFIIAIAPHTSNWDFVFGIALKLALNLRLKFLGKNALFIWPFKGVLAALGGIAVDRNTKHGVVGQMVEMFQQSEQLVLALAPEGTRHKTKEWKTGFLHIAHQANIPVVPASLDFAKKELHIQEAVYISDDIASELQIFKTKFSNCCAKNPQAV